MDIANRLKKIADKGGNIRILSNTIISPSTKSVIKDFSNSFTKTNEDETVTNTVKHVQIIFNTMQFLILV